MVYFPLLLRREDLGAGVRGVSDLVGRIEVVLEVAGVEPRKGRVPHPTISRC
jgi:hypothetical protein